MFSLQALLMIVWLSSLDPSFTKRTVVETGDEARNLFISSQKRLRLSSSLYTGTIMARPEFFFNFHLLEWGITVVESGRIRIDIVSRNINRYDSRVIRCFLNKSHGKAA